MKTEFIDVSDTQKNLVVEIPSTVVDAEIDKVARDYSRAARVPGFRPGKVPAKVVRQRFRDQILHDVAHGLIPRAVDEALRERGVEPVDTPDIRDVVVEEGQPLKFTATFETVPPIEPGDYASITLQQKNTAMSTTRPLTQALNNLRDRAARYEPVVGRGIQRGDSVVMDLVRTAFPKQEEPLIVIAGELRREASDPQTDKHEDVTVEIGGTANPPGFDDQLIGLQEGRDEDLRRPLSGRLRHRRTGRNDGQLLGHREGDSHARRAGARRRVREGPGRVREPRRAADARSRRPRARGDARSRARHARRAAEPARRRA